MLVCSALLMTRELFDFELSDFAEELSEALVSAVILFPPARYDPRTPPPTPTQSARASVPAIRPTVFPLPLFLAFLAGYDCAVLLFITLYGTLLPYGLWYAF